MERLTRYLAYSILIHLLLLLFFRLPLKTALEKEAAAPIWVDLKKGKYQIADILAQANPVRPKEADFLGMENSQTDRETVAEVQGKAKQRTSSQKLRTENRERKTDDRWKYSDKSKTLEDGTPGDALPEDYYPDFKKGEHTYLNVMRFPEIQYFVRLKRVFKMTWNPHPSLQNVLYNQISTGHIETVLGFSIDKGGNLTEVFIFKSSGLKRYDDEALRTIRASAPFSTPPTNFLAKDGVLHMNYTFTAYL